MKRNNKDSDEIQYSMSRRKFLGLSAAGAGAAVAAGSGFDQLQAYAAKYGDVVRPTIQNGEVYSLCEMCVWRCGLVAKVRNGKITKLEGNPHHPHSRGKLCPRGQAGLGVTYDPDRLKWPLIRVGKRGEGKFRKVTWGEALDYIAEQMLAIKKKHGPEAMVFSTTHNLLQQQFENLLGAFGSPNYGTQRSLCFNSMITANMLTYGFEEPGRDYKDTAYIIYAGRNLMEAISNSETQDLVEAIANGAKVVVLDPRFSKTAARATDWIPIRPGTDLAFFLAMIHEIIATDLHNKEFVEKYTFGFDELAKEVKKYTPEWAEKECGVSAETIRRVARDFAIAAPRAFAHPNWRTSNFVNSFQTERAIAVLNSIVGNWNKAGGQCPIFGEGEGAGLGSIPQPPYPRSRALRLDGVPYKYPLVPLKLGIFQNLRDAMLTGKPYQAHGWFIYRQNPLSSIPERRKTLQAMAKLDFITVIDVIMNDTAYYADVVLPEATYLERYDPLTVLEGNIYIRQPVIEPLFDSKPGLWIFKELGKRLGLGDYFQYKDEEDYIQAQLRPLPITLEKMKEQGMYVPFEKKEESIESTVFNTSTGKIELSSTLLKRLGHKSVPHWLAPPRPTEEEFYLLTGKVALHTQFFTQNNKLLSDLFPENPLWIHTSAAAQRGIKDGDEVYVESRVGKVKTKALVTEGIRPDCVFMVTGFGHFSKGMRTAFKKGVSDSDLHQTFTDPISGGQALTQTFVKVYKA